MPCIPHTNTYSSRIKHAAGRVCRKLTLDEPSYLCQKQDPQKEEVKKREWADTNEQVKYVVKGGKVQCQYASPPTADIVVIDAGRVSLQDKLMATNKDTNGKVNFNFTGVCNHPSQQKPSSPPPPCKAVINLGQWENCSETKINDDNALLVKSTIKCNVSGEDIKIVDSGQKAELTEVEPVTSPEMNVYDAYWIDKDHNEQRELSMGEAFQLHVEVQHYLPNTEIKFHFENTDNGSCQIPDVSGIVDKNGIVKIKDFQLKPTEPTSTKTDKPKKATTDKTNSPKKETIKITGSSPYCTVEEWAFIKVNQEKNSWHDPVDNPQLCLYTQGGNEVHYWGCFGETIRATNSSKVHAGVDIFAIPGTTVYACADGTIARVYTSDSLAGRVISLKITDKEAFLKAQKANFQPYFSSKGEIVDKNFNYKGDVYIVYMHLQEFLVKAGQTVKAGQVIAKSGHSGGKGVNFSTKNPHLHLEISNNISNGGINNKANPLQFFDIKQADELSADEKQIQTTAKNKGY